MITFLKGTVDEIQPTRVVMDVGGVGYEILIPLSSYDQLPAVGEACRILTFDYVREDRHQLFGFMTEDERVMFVQLMSTSGIGPKLALSALSGMSVRELKAAIFEGDVKRLSGISGVGKKMAERMVVELRDKISDVEGVESVGGLGDLSDLRMSDSIMALMSLGYKQDAARKMVTDVLKRAGSAEFAVEDVIRTALGG